MSYPNDLSLPLEQKPANVQEAREVVSISRISPSQIESVKPPSKALERLMNGKTRPSLADLSLRVEPVLETFEQLVIAGPCVPHLMQSMLQGHLPKACLHSCHISARRAEDE